MERIREATMNETVWSMIGVSNQVLRGQPLSDFPRPRAIFFVVARSPVQDGRPFLIPNWRIFFKKIRRLFLGRKRAQSRTSRETKSNYLLETFVNQLRFALNEILGNFN